MSKEFRHHIATGGYAEFGALINCPADRDFRGLPQRNRGKHLSSRSRCFGVAEKFVPTGRERGFSLIGMLRRFARCSAAATRHMPPRRQLSFAPIAAVQDGLAYAQLATGLPWCATIAGSAVALRLAILPTVIHQVRQTRRLLGLRPRFAALRRECAAITSPNERARTLAVRMYSECRQHGVEPLSVIGLPLVQIPLLLGLLVSVRRLLLPDAPHAPALRVGGILWFRDLTVPDPTAALPLMSLLVMLANLQLSLSTGRPGGLLLGLRNFAQAGAVVGLPFYAELPAGLFMYWLPNSAFSLAQTAAVRRLSPLAVEMASPEQLRQAHLQQQQQQALQQQALQRHQAAQPPPQLSLASSLPLVGAMMGASAAEARSATATTAIATATATTAATPGTMPTSSTALPLAAASAQGGAPGHPEGAFLIRDPQGVTLIRDPEGAAAWRARIAADPTDVTAHVELSKLLLRAKQPEAAMAHLWPAVQVAPQAASGPIRFQLALALALEGQYDVAEPLLEQVLQLDPEFVEGRICLCNVLEARGQLGRAVAALEEVRALRPDLEAWCAREIGRLLRQQAGGGAGAST